VDLSSSTGSTLYWSLARLAPQLVKFSSVIWFYSSQEAGEAAGSSWRSSPQPSGSTLHGRLARQLAPPPVELSSTILFYSSLEAGEAAGSSIGGVLLNHLVLLFTEDC